MRGAVWEYSVGEMIHGDLGVCEYAGGMCMGGNGKGKSRALGFSHSAVSALGCAYFAC